METYFSMIVLVGIGFSLGVGGMLGVRWFLGVERMATKFFGWIVYKWVTRKEAK
ncbi:hypothetical protein K6U16_15040 [Vibrio parahaemolyticus]|uniref:hypothetical protein n=1 Tax=Vibrio parahaemolyticus TaxID=670 RepID=UPI001DF4528B|nr:hypothetical protein [Vibrio parahaemolyticus]EHM1247525.1 hypothetical protein [Salmonella enterica]MCG6424288.1 hypothetical protein [Vibrio parahaemolyticus]HCE3391915.1 hypothetical protein [Vibrio parahaemolyticus]